MDETQSPAPSSPAPSSGEPVADPGARHGGDAVPGAASLVMLATEPAVRFERMLAAAPQEVWRSLTDPDGLREWFPCSIAAQRWEVGAALTFTFPGQAEFTVDGVVLECDRPRVLAYLWGQETLRFDLEPLPAGSAGAGESGGTRLVMVDELSAPVAARNAAGWHLCLDRLAGHAPAEGRQEWRRLFALYRAAFEPSLGPQEGPPAGFEDGG